MFTGIVQELGEVLEVTSLGDGDGGRRIEIGASAVLADLAVGGSVAVDGCCLTAVEVGADRFGVEAVSETLARTSLAGVSVGQLVNLERPVSAASRLDGHVVQGHVDATGRVRDRRRLDDGSFDLSVGAPPEVVRYLVEKGSVAVDGVSLTVVDVDEGGFRVALIPHTAEVTTLGHKDSGAPVNLEVDVLAKYVERFVAPYAPSPGVLAGHEGGAGGPRAETREEA